MKLKNCWPAVEERGADVCVGGAEDAELDDEERDRDSDSHVAEVDQALEFHSATIITG